MNNRQLELLPPEIARSLAALDRKVRVLAMLRGIAWLVILVLAGIGAGILLDLWLDLGESLRVGLLAGLGLACCAVIVWGILRPLFRKTAPTEIAALFETAHPELRERLSSSVELLDVSEPETLKGSPLMRELLLRETTEVVRGADLGDAVDGARAQKAGWIAVAVMFLMVLPLFYSRDGYLLLLTRFFAPWQNLERASNLYFVVDRGDRTVPRGSDVNLLAEPRWRLDTHEIPDEVWLNWTNDGGEADVRRMLWDPDLKAFTATLPHVFHPFDFNVTSDAARTRDYHVNVVEPPSIASLMVDVQPPAYTGLPAQRLDGAVGETVVFERSRVRFELQFNKPVASAEVVWLSPPVHTPIVHNQLTGAGTVAANGAPDTLTPVQEKVPFDLSSDRTSGTLEFDALPDIGGRFALRLTDEHDLQNDDEPLRSLRVQPDLPPNIAFADRVDAPEARPDDVVPIPVTAEDDIAVHELELHYSVVPQGGRNAVSAEGRLLGVKSVDYSFRLDLARLTTDLGAPLPLKNNDRLRIRVRAADERPIPGPNEAWTEERTITIRDDAEPYGFEMIAQTRDQWRDLLESIQRELEQNRQQIGELKEEAESDLRQEVAFDENQALPPLAAHQREQATRLDQLSALLASSPLYANLAKQTQAVAHEELVEAPAALDAAFPAELAQKPEQLAKSAEQLDAALAKLDGLSEGFDEIARLERDLSEIQRLAEQAQRLSEDAIALEEERNNPPADLPPERQQSRDAALEMARQD
ncbi:MAG: hypothetical protein KDA75_09945, partial [Planctomycetaceae bacterium]|nr:hypothetical protein [Planctomycetaceae bacterium]